VSTWAVTVIPSAVGSPVVYLPAQATCGFIIAMASASVKAAAAGALRVESTNNSHIRSEVMVT
jgi:hypothetical protein